MSTALVKINDKETSIALLDGDLEESKTILKETLQEYVSSEFGLPRLQLPSSGGKLWQYESATGTKACAYIDGVLLAYSGRHKSFFRRPMGEGDAGQPPDCSSVDGITGYGYNAVEDGATVNGEHACAECPMNEFGSKPGSRGKMCQDKGHAFFVPLDERLPRFLSVPATSLSNFRKYMIGLAGEGCRPHTVITRLELVQEKNQSNIPYSVAVPKMIAKLSKEQAEFFGAIAANIKASISNAAAGTRAVS